MDLWCGSNNDVLPSLPAGTVDVVLQDPPFGTTWARRRRLGQQRAPKATDGWKFAGRHWDVEPVVHDPSWWATLRRVLSNNATVLSFGAPKTWHHQANAIADAGLHLHAVWAWVVAGGLPASINVRRELERAGASTDVLDGVPSHEYSTGLMQAWTPILVATTTNSPTDLPTEGTFYQPRIQPSEQILVDGLKHPTQKPAGLLTRLLQFANVPTGTHLLDPFAGTGSSAVAAKLHGCEWTGIELCDGTDDTPDYVALARANCDRHEIDLQVHR